MARLVKRELDKALAQFIGYRAAKDGESLVGLAQAMGLTRREYLAIREDIPVARFVSDERRYLDDLFNVDPAETDA